MSQMKKTALIWFRNDLRTLDHPGLQEATQKYERVMAYYSFDPRHYTTDRWGFKKTERYRAQFLLQTLKDLREQLSQLNISLIVETQTPETGLPQIIQKWAVQTVFLQAEWTEEEKQVEDAVRNQVDASIQWRQNHRQFLYEPSEVPMRADQTPEVFTVFRKKCEKYGRVKETLSHPTAMPESNRLLEPCGELPTLEQLGLKTFTTDQRTAFPFEGGTSAGLHRLHHYFWDKQKLSYYKNTRNGLVGIDYSSKFSAWLANGSLSPKMIYWEVKRYEKEVIKNQSTYWLIFELIWRDYFKYISLKHQSKIFQLGGILERDYSWDDSPKKLVQWAQGETREPFVNANMLELKHTGWMSNRGRQNVASFFAKDLLMDWRMGAAYFESLLIDYDVHSNYGNWLYVSGVGNDPRDRKFNIKMQAERYDPDHKFQKLWLQQTLF